MILPLVLLASALALTDPPPTLADNVRQAVAALDALRQPLPPAARAKLDVARALPDPAARSAAIQAAIDPECLLTVAIGPESRVSIGPARPVLEQHGWRTFLIKVENPSGSTPELHLRPSRSSRRLFDLADTPTALLPPRLTGRPVEYRLGRISPRRVGRHPLELIVRLSDGVRTRDVEVRPDVSLTSHPHSASLPDLRVPADSNTLADAVAEADRLDPGWRLAEVEANRVDYPPDRNGALRVAEVVKLIPEGSPESKAVRDERDGLNSALDQPNCRLTTDQARSLNDRLESDRPAVTLARTVEGFEGGHHPRVYAMNFIETMLPDIQACRGVGRLLQLDTLDRIERREPDAALGSCRAVIGVGRCAVGDDPFAISQLVRIAIVMTGTDSIERVMAQGEPSGEALARTQALLVDEAEEPCSSSRSGGSAPA